MKSIYYVIYLRFVYSGVHGMDTRAVRFRRETIRGFVDAASVTSSRGAIFSFIYLRHCLFRNGPPHPHT